VSRGGDGLAGRRAVCSPRSFSSHCNSCRALDLNSFCLSSRMSRASSLVCDRRIDAQGWLGWMRGSAQCEGSSWVRVPVPSTSCARHLGPGLLRKQTHGDVPLTRAPAGTSAAGQQQVRGARLLPRVRVLAQRNRSAQRCASAARPRTPSLTLPSPLSWTAVTATGGISSAPLICSVEAGGFRCRGASLCRGVLVSGPYRWAVGSQAP
jgi:hypothetical protein